MQQRFNRPAKSWIFKWLGHVGLCLYAKGQFQVLQAWQIWRTHLIALQLALKKLWDDLHHAKVCQNGCHRHSSLWFLCDVTSTCRVFETSREQVSCILESRRDIDPGSTAGAALCNASFGPDKSGIRWTNRDSIVHGFRSPVQGVFPILFPPRIAFSVSPITADLCSFQQAAFEVHLSSVGTKTASNQRRLQFQAILFDHTDPLQGFPDCAEAQVEAKLTEIVFHRATVES